MCSLSFRSKSIPLAESSSASKFRTFRGESPSSRQISSDGPIGPASVATDNVPSADKGAFNDSEPGPF
jgi:hypothetical protein